MKHLFLLLALWFILPRLFSQVAVSIGQEEIIIILEAHNAERRQVGSPELVWDEKLAEYARGWAMILAKDDTKIWHRPNNQYGENIAWFSGDDFEANRGVDLWNSEKDDYIYCRLTSGNFRNTGHYTQVIWQNTRKVGCGCVKSQSGAYNFVCNYDPAGNYTGEYPYKR